MKVINFYAAPGCGKTTLAAMVFAELKKIFSAVEINLEYARILINEGRTSILEDNQLYIFTKQEKVLRDFKRQGIEYVVTDSPLILSSIYNNPDSLDQNIFDALIMDLYHRYDNLNFYFQRNPSFGYDSRCRIQKSQEEADLIDQKIVEKLNQFQIPYFTIENKKNTVDKIIEVILQEKMK